MAGLLEAINNTTNTIKNAANRVVNTAFSQNGEGVRGTNAYGVRGSSSNNQDVDDAGYGYPWGYGGGGGWGGSGGGKTPEQAQEETQAQIDNTTGNYMDRGKDLSDLGIQNLNNIMDQIQQNEDFYRQQMIQNMRNLEWQPQQQREQSMLGNLRNRIGNGAYGSGIVDLMEGLGRVDDMADVALISGFKQNANAAYGNYFQANEDLISDYSDQSTAIQDEFSKLRSQYWSTLSNINPLLASKDNLKKSAAGESVSVGEGTDAYTLPAGTRLEPSDTLKELLKTPERADAYNPYTRNLIRPDRAVSAARTIPNTGSANRSTAANQGYLDNLGIYQRRI